MIDLLLRAGKMAWAIGLPEILVIVFVLGMPLAIVFVILVIVNSKQNRK